jgi:hypothetical protein
LAPPPTLPLTPASALLQPTSCTHRSTFVTDVRILDNTHLAPGVELAPG